jgi:allantoin racemase
MRIMVIMGEYPAAEGEQRRQACLKCASPDTEIGFITVHGTFFQKTNSQANALAVAPLIGEAAQKAEAQGFEAVVPFGTLDLGVEMARNLVRIPVVGNGQSVLHLGAQLSERLGIITYEEKTTPFMRKNMRAWGVYDYIAAIRAINIPLADSSTYKEDIRNRFMAAARYLIDEAECEIIVPMGVTMVPVLYSATEFSAELGVPVLDALATAIHTAEMLVRMKATHSIKTYPLKRKEA